MPKCSNQDCSEPVPHGIDMCRPCWLTIPKIKRMKMWAKTRRSGQADQQVNPLGPKSPYGSITFLSGTAYDKHKVIFLDIDGVLNSNGEVIYNSRKRGGFGEYRAGWWSIRNIYRKILSTILSPVYWAVPHDTKLGQFMTLFSLYYLCDHCDQCPIATSNLQYILDSVPDAKFVVTSTWRNKPDWYLKGTLRRNNIDVSRMLGKTGFGRGPRGRQIREWLRSHPGVKRYVILDDDRDMMPYQKGRFIHVNNYNGLTYTDAVRAIDILKGRKFKKNFAYYT